jgi:hypothetical protein
MRLLCVILLIVAHALKYVSTDSTPSGPIAVAASVKEMPIEQPEQPVTITEAQPKPQALPTPKRKRIQRANVDNLERVRVYLLDHPELLSNKFLKTQRRSHVSSLKRKWRLWPFSQGKRTNKLASIHFCLSCSNEEGLLRFPE